MTRRSIMSTTLWNSTVDSIGADAAEMLEAGVVILFGSPVPDELAEVSLVHGLGGDRAVPPSEDVVPGDRVRLGAAEYVIDEVGSEANPNLASLGHVVVYVNSPDQPLLPGAVKASGPELPTMSVGNPIAFVRG